MADASVPNPIVRDSLLSGSLLSAAAADFVPAANMFNGVAGSDPTEHPDSDLAAVQIAVHHQSDSTVGGGPGFL